MTARNRSSGSHRKSRYLPDSIFLYLLRPSLSSAEPILSAGHGSYVFNASRLSETIENHSNTALVGQTFSVTAVLSKDGNAFEQEVDLGKYILRERWVRIE